MGTNFLVHILGFLFITMESMGSVIHPLNLFHHIDGETDTTPICAVQYCDILGKAAPNSDTVFDPMAVADFNICMESITAFTKKFPQEVDSVEEFANVCKAWKFDDDYCADVLIHLKDYGWSMKQVIRELSAYGVLLEDNKYKKFEITQEDWMFLKEHNFLSNGLEILIAETYNYNKVVKTIGGAISPIAPIAILRKGVEFFNKREEPVTLGYQAITNRCNTEEMIGVYLIMIQVEFDEDEFLTILKEICLDDTKTTHWKYPQLMNIAESALAVAGESGYRIPVIRDFLKYSRALIDSGWFSKDPKKVDSKWSFTNVTKYVFQLPESGVTSDTTARTFHSKPATDFLSSVFQFGLTYYEVEELKKGCVRPIVEEQAKVGCIGLFLDIVLNAGENGKLWIEHEDNVNDWNFWLDKANRHYIKSFFDLMITFISRQLTGECLTSSTRLEDIIISQYNSRISAEAMTLLVYFSLAGGQDIITLQKCMNFISSVNLSVEILLRKNSNYNRSGNWIPDKFELLDFAMNIFMDDRNEVLCDNKYSNYVRSSIDNLLVILKRVLSKP